MNDILNKQNKICKLKQELDKYKLEQKYFEEYYENQEIGNIKIGTFKKMSSKKIIEYLACSNLSYDNNLRVKIISKLVLIFRFGMQAFQARDINYILSLFNRKNF